MSTTQIATLAADSVVPQFPMAATFSQPVTIVSPTAPLDELTRGAITASEDETTSLDLGEPTSETLPAVSVLILIQFAIGWVGIIGNSLVVAVFISGRSNGRNQTNVLIIHQAFVDLLASTVLVLYSGYTIVGSPTTNSRFLKAFACYFWTRVTLFALFAVSTFNLALISVERYVATVWPLKYSRLFVRGNLRCLLALVWIFGPICQYFLAFATRSFRDGTCTRIRSPAWVGIPLFMWEYLIPVAIMTVSFMSIIKKLTSLERKVFGVTSIDVTSTVANVEASRSVTAQGNTSSADEREDNPIHGSVSVIASVQQPSQVLPPPSLATRRTGGHSVRRRNATQSIILVYFVYVLCWSPNQLAFFQLSLGGTLDFGGIFYQISVVLTIFNTCVNPFIYAFRHKVYKAKLWELYRAIIIRCRPN